MSMTLASSSMSHNDNYVYDGTAIVALFYIISCSIVTTGQFKITSVVFDFVAMPADLDEQKQ